MKIYNTFTRKKEEFIPIDEGKVKMYVCGPTVYNYIHIGNARPFIVFDTIRRYFIYKGLDVTYVQNFTDIDDKIIKKAFEENVDFTEISEKYIKETQIDAENLNVLLPSFTPKVTEEIDNIIKMISKLIQKGYAYEVEGSVFFETKKAKNYGKLSLKNIDELESGARISIDEKKKSPMDFVLWKPAKIGEPKWSSPWSEGRPGWHIECSVMAKKYLGDTVDIHAGGEDLVFPHHENEIAQSECANGVKFANYWMHNGFINVDNQKMSKSKGNFFTLREIGEEYPYEVIRFFMLMAHYRSPINFSRELIVSAKTSLFRIENCVENISFLSKNAVNSKITEDEKKLLIDANVFKTEFEKAMEDDFNTADAVASIFELVKFSNINATKDNSKEFLEEIKNKIVELCDILGVVVINGEKTPINNNVNALNNDVEEIEKLIDMRQEARANKNWNEADEIRNKLLKMGVVLKDTSSGARWSYENE